MHSALVLWMVQLLLTSTHTLQESVEREGESGERQNKREENRGSEDTQEEGGEGDEETEEEEEGEEVGVGEIEKNFEEGMGLTAVLSVDLKTEYQSLSDSLKRFTTALTR